MKVKGLITIGQTVEITTENGQTFRCKIEDIPSSGILLGNPMYRHEYVNLRSGSTVCLSITTTRGSYLFTSVVKQTVIRRGVKMLLVAMPSRGERIQRRRFFRLKKLLAVRMRKFGEDEYHEAETRDVSGGGLLLVTDCACKVGERVELLLTVPGMEPVGAVGCITRSSRESGKQLLACEFTVLEERDRRRIIAYLLKEQARLRRNHRR